MSEFNFVDLIHEDQIFLDFVAQNQADLIGQLSSVLQQKSYVLPGYADQVIAREEEYPTGLPTKVMTVAIPHAIESTSVVVPSIVIARMKTPVEFNEMGSYENKVQVDLVMLLAVKGDKSQLVILQKLIGMFSDEPSMEKLKNAATPHEFYELFRELQKN